MVALAFAATLLAAVDSGLLDSGPVQRPSFLQPETEEMAKPDHTIFETAQRSTASSVHSSQQPEQTAQRSTASLHSSQQPEQTAQRLTASSVHSSQQPEQTQHYTPYVRFAFGINRTFYSLHEQDRMLIDQYPGWMSWSGEKTFLEMGALDGQRVSNTKFFYDDLGWRGVLVEPQPACRPLIERVRPNDRVFSNASCADFGTLNLDITPGECLGGVGGDDFLTEARKSTMAGLQRLEVGCSPIGHMLSVAGVKQLDLWSLDVEGAEYDVLLGMDWAHVPVHALLIEMLAVNNPRGEAGLEDIRSLLRANGMRFVRKMGTAGWDELWQNVAWDPESLPLNLSLPLHLVPSSRE